MVPAITLDNFFLKRKKKSPNLGEIIKLDTQGAEHKILKGAKKVLKNNTMCIICEVSVKDENGLGTSSIIIGVFIGPQIHLTTAI